MGKRVEKALRGGAPTSASSRAGDDCSTPEPYTCTGNFSDDFTELWQRAGLDKDFIPVVRPRGKRPGTPTVDDAKTTAEEEHSEPAEEEPLPTSYTLVDNLFIKRPSIQVEFDVEETKQLQINHAKEIFIRSWRLEEKVVNVLKQCGLDRLQCINLWNVGLTEHALKSLAGFLPNLTNLKTLVLDGNPLPETEPYHYLIAEDSTLQHLSLRNNKITDIGAKQISQCLGQNGSQNRCLTTLNLSYNHIADEGAKHLAQGLRMNRVLLSLSLASNHISDPGCTALCGVLQRFPLTHEEVVQRRKLMSQQGYFGRGSSAPGSRRGDSKDRPGSNRSGSQMAARASRGSSKKKDGKKGEVADKTAKKDERGKKGELNKIASKLSVTSEAPKGGKGKKSGGAKEGGKRLATQNNATEVDASDLPEFVHPLLDPNTEHTEGKVFVPGCMTLVNLNLSRNRIGAVGMKSMLTAIQYQVTRRRMLLDSPVAPGLLKVFLQKNLVPDEHPIYVAIQDTMLTRDPTYKPEEKSPEEDAQSVVG
uniref:Leucine-rich repeat-containing protein 71 n=1 Tax=Phallusia mammillata TaxID=59560 RepID=A0A6F9DKP3_9ASCI|nr:leucine-rich repeat-containing protein 71 [Phallusia mammillata]